MDDVLPESSDSQNGDTEQDAVENTSQDENNDDKTETSTENQIINEPVADNPTTQETVEGMFQNKKFLIAGSIDSKTDKDADNIDKASEYDHDEKESVKSDESEEIVVNGQFFSFSV